MTGTFLLALALAQTAPQAEPPGLQITTVTRFANGPEKLGGMFFIPNPIGPSGAIYYFANPTVCEGMGSSSLTGIPGTRVAGPKFGWQVEVISPPGAAVVLKWSRLDGAARAVAPMNGTKTLPKELPVFRNVELDRLEVNLPGGDGCDAVSYSLVARYAPAFRPRVTQAKLIEAELWFVHKAPDGKETSQRQVIRIRQNAGAEFYFDDIELQTRWLEKDLTLTVEVFGRLIVGGPDDGEIPLTLDLTRRYLSKEFLIGKWPKSGSTELPTSVAVGEVVSFVLPPLQDDSGVFLGHRFSVRMRLKPLAPEQNQR